MAMIPRKPNPPLVDPVDGIPPIKSPSGVARLLDRWHDWQRRQEERKDAERRRTPEARFNQLLATATEIANINPNGLIDLIRAILRPLQSERLLHVAEYGFSKANSLNYGHLFGPAVTLRMWQPDGSALRCAKPEPTDYQLNLATDPVLPWPWHWDRYANALATIGSRKEVNPPHFGFPRWQGGWRQRTNHSVELWLPWGIGFVSSGNHSMTAGILAGEGTICPDEVYDMAYILDEVRCDGRYYRDIATNKPIHPMSDPRTGAVFEIGRLLIEHGVQPALRPVSEGAASRGLGSTRR